MNPFQNVCITMGRCLGNTTSKTNNLSPRAQSNSNEGKLSYKIP